MTRLRRGAASDLHLSSPPFPDDRARPATCRGSHDASGRRPRPPAPSALDGRIDRKREFCGSSGRSRIAMSMQEQGMISSASRKELAWFSSSLRRRKFGRSSVCHEREHSLRHLRQVLKETEKAIGVQERESARLRASIERSRDAARKPAWLDQMNFVGRRLAFVRQAKMEIEREIEGLKRAA